MTDLVGNRSRRLDVDDKVTGLARYASDQWLPGTLIGKIVRSDRPSARIVRLDVSAAEALPGVEAVILGDRNGQPFGEIVKDQLPFANERVRYAGEPIAAIAAESEAIAIAAAALIEIEYEDLLAIFDPIAALQPDAWLVHDDVAAYAGPATLERHGNVCSRVELRHGDVEEAFAQATRIIEGDYTTHSVHQSPMEPRACLVVPDARGRITVHASTQHPFGVRHQLHEALGLPVGDIRVVAETIGGGFGAKLEASVEIYAALLARATGRPVRLVNSREEDLVAANPRHPIRYHLKTALDEAGRITGRDVRAVMDAGAYAGGSPVLTSVAALLASGPYKIPRLRIEVLAVHTNNVPFGSFRGPSGPQTIFAVESHTDEIARALGVDPLAFRLDHIYEEGDVAANGQVLQGVGLREAIEQAAAAIGWGQRESAPEPHLRRGKGLACAWWTTTAGSAGCGVQVNEDGSVVIQTGAAEIGTGAVAAGVAQIVASELGVAMEKIRLVWGDTDATPMDAGAQGSRTVFNMGRAAQEAATAARMELFRRAAEALEAAETDLEVSNGRVSVRGVPDCGITYADLMAGQMWASQPVVTKGTFLAAATPHDEERMHGGLYTAFNAPSFHCHAAEVEVDLETGLTRVVDYVVAQDVGKAINPTYVEGQMQGGAVQGIGYALTEELHYEDGRLLNPNLALYKLPTTLEAPRVRTVIVEHPAAEGPHGAKGVGEPPVIVPPAAIAAAISDAIGTPIRDTPFTPERVLRAVRRGEHDTA